MEIEKALSKGMERHAEAGHELPRIWKYGIGFNATDTYLIYKGAI